MSGRSFDDLLESQGMHSPVYSPQSWSVDGKEQAWDAVYDGLSERFGELFQELFVGEARTVELCTDLRTAKDMSFRNKEERGPWWLKDFTPAMRETMKDRIPKFVDDEFGDDLLAQSMHVLGAALRMIYQAQIDAQLGSDEDSDEEVAPLKIDRERVVNLLVKVVGEYILDSKDGVEVVGRIVSRRLQGPPAGDVPPVG